MLWCELSCIAISGYSAKQEGRRKESLEISRVGFFRDRRLSKFLGTMLGELRTYRKGNTD